MASAAGPEASSSAAGSAAAGAGPVRAVQATALSFNSSNHAFGGFLADALDFQERRHIPTLQSAQHSLGALGSQNIQRDLGAHPVHREQCPEDLALFQRQKPIERHFIFAHHEVGGRAARIPRAPGAKGGAVHPR